MTAKIIDFRVHQPKSDRPDYREPPRGRAKRAARRPAGRVSVGQQVAHIAWLLRELEEIARGGERLPQVLVAEANAGIERARTMLQSWPVIRTSGKTDAMEETAQPNIDPALLERMYSDLGLHP